MKEGCERHWISNKACLFDLHISPLELSVETSRPPTLIIICVGFTKPKDYDITLEELLSEEGRGASWRAGSDIKVRCE